MGKFSETSRAGQQDDWVAPSKAERLDIKKAANQAPTVPLTLEQQLDVANLNDSLDNVDFHGKPTSDVDFEIDQLIDRNPGEIVRIIYGHGTGAIAGKVMNHLRDLSKGKGARIESYKTDPVRASCVIKVK